MSRICRRQRASVTALVMALVTGPVMLLGPSGAWPQSNAESRSNSDPAAQAPVRLDSLPALPTLGPSADVPRPPGQEAPGQAVRREGISASDPGSKALSRGREAREAGNLEAAAGHFQDALIRATPGSEVYWSARDELNFHLPLKRVEGLIASEDWPEVEETLRGLMDRYESDERKSLYLLRLISQLQERVPDDVRDRRGQEGGRTVMKNVERTLEQFHAQRGRYPRGYRELNQVLPPDREPLSEYDIVDYVNRGGAYGLTLRNKENPENVIRVQKTGLVQ